MSENVTPTETPNVNAPDTQNAQAGLTSTPSDHNGNGALRANRLSNRNLVVQSSTNRDFKGATPKLGAVLALRSENINKNVNYDRFL